MIDSASIFLEKLKSNSKGSVNASNLLAQDTIITAFLEAGSISNRSIDDELNIGLG